MLNDYIINGEVARDKIAMDIKYRKINRDSIEKLCADHRIKSAFIGGSPFSNKRPKQEWDKEYLARLSYAVVAESFNREYLLYLDEVADFVSKATFKTKVTFKKMVIAGIIIVVVIIAGVIVCKYVIGS